MQKKMFWTTCLLFTISYANLAQAEGKTFFPFSTDCEEYCNKEGLKVDFQYSKMESKCKCYPE